MRILFVACGLMACFTAAYAQKPPLWQSSPQFKGQTFGGSKVLYWQPEVRSTYTDSNGCIEVWDYTGDGTGYGNHPYPYYQESQADSVALDARQGAIAQGNSYFTTVPGWAMTCYLAGPSD